MRRGLAAGILVSLLVTATAWADETITAHPPNQFASPVTTIDQGEKVTFRNEDVDAHNVTSTRDGDDGKPLFRSALISGGSSGPVVGTEYLTTGNYPFICTIHPWMEATLEVTSAGTPVARPEPEPAGELKMRIATKRLRPVVRKGKLKVRVRSAEGSVRLRARARSGKRRVAFRGKTVAFDELGGRRVALRLSKKGRKALRGRRRAKVVVRAVADHAGGGTAKAKAARILR